MDALDERIVKLLNDRAALVRQIGQIKRDAGQPTYAADRERDVLDRVAGLNTGPMPQQTLAAIYRELMSGSLALERAPRIAYLGPAGSFSHLAAAKKFGSSVAYHALEHIPALFDEIERGRVDLALVPIENSGGGGIVDTLEALVDHQVTVGAEINLAVHHYLWGSGTLEQVQTVCSKPEVFTQCRRWLIETGLMARTQPVASTSKAAELAASDPTTAAIAGALAGELYKLRCLAERIEDDPNNTTRFLVLGGSPAKPSGDDKTAVYFCADDRPGALVEILDAFRQRGINLTFIQSRPSRERGFHYAFFVDLAGHVDTPEVAAALDAARAYCARFKILGSFPRATEVL